MKIQHIRGRKLNDYLRRKGKVWKGKTMTVRFLRGAPPHPGVDPDASAIYLGTSASVKLDKSAVKRNRMRRRCREAWRTTVKEYDNLPTLQLLVSPRAASLACDYSQITTDVENFLSTL